ncbi:MAG TPA: N-acetylmuramoyl-L-alanine amidase [Coleofasciculaceae cyanobacterium]
MVKIFLSAGHGAGDPGARAGGASEEKEMIETRNAVVKELRSRDLEVLWVPDTLTLKQTIYWINDHSSRGDVALEIHADAFSNTKVRGASIYYIDENEQRKADAELVLEELLEAVPKLPSRGVKPDTATGVGRLGFCRKIDVPFLLLELGFITNSEDRFLLQAQRENFARGIADGLQAWSYREAIRQGLVPPPITYPAINIKINDKVYENQGILVNGNACVPIVLLAALGVDAEVMADLQKIIYRNVIYVKAVNLQRFNVSVNWDNSNRTVILGSKSKT